MIRSNHGLTRTVSAHHIHRAVLYIVIRDIPSNTVADHLAWIHSLDLDLDLDLDNSRQEPEAITATSGCALRKSGEPTLEGRYCVGLSN